jgi:hypothetical protein
MAAPPAKDQPNDRRTAWGAQRDGVFDQLVATSPHIVAQAPDARAEVVRQRTASRGARGAAVRCACGGRTRAELDATLVVPWCGRNGTARDGTDRNMEIEMSGNGWY